MNLRLYVFASVIALAACGGGGSGGGITPSTPPPKPTTTPTTTPTTGNAPLMFTISGVPSTARAGTAIAAAPLAITVLGANNQPISGTYAQPVTISDSDTTGATTLSLNGAPPARSVTLTSSTDTAKVTFNYTGRAIAAVTLAASAPGAVGATATFTPALAPIVASTSEIDLISSSGAGSSGSVTISELGFSGTFGGHFTATPSSHCASFAAITPTNGSTFTVTATSAPVAGTCSLSLSDGLHTNPIAITLTYTSSSLGVQ